MIWIQFGIKLGEPLKGFNAPTPSNQDTLENIRPVVFNAGFMTNFLCFKCFSPPDLLNQISALLPLHAIKCCRSLIISWRLIYKACLITKLVLKTAQVTLYSNFVMYGKKGT